MKLDKVTNLVSLLIYFLSIAQVAKKTILSSTLEYSPWSYSELIIFYPGLFTRRGFLGELITLIDSDLILFDTVNFILFINFIIFILLSFAHIIISKLTPLQHLLYLISIFGILNITLFNQYYHRKEMFVLNLFMLTLLIIKINTKTTITFIATVTLSILMILIHEGIAMITIAFIILILKKKTSFSPYLIKTYSTIIFLSFIGVILSSGNDTVSDLIWGDLSEFDRSLISIETNAITAIGWSLLDSFFETTQVLIFSGSMFLWSFYFAMFIWTFLVIFKIEPNKINLSTIPVKEFLLKEKYFIVIPILFFVGFDWGRWIFSLFHLSFFSFLILNDKIYKNKNWSISIGALVLVSLLTIMPECCLQMEGTTVSSNYYRVIKSIQLTFQSAFG
ncbi:hypothetical protein N9L62_01955 [Candidatus Actinomarina sp.]|nr:hypothetical protein [Candidatus Actinomarina sp.]